MKRRMDRFFSPERLSARWGETPVADEVEAEVETAAPVVAWEKLRDVVMERFPAQHSVGLHRIVEMLGAAVVARFTEPAPEGKVREALDEEIAIQLARIEDLADVAVLTARVR